MNTGYSELLSGVKSILFTLYSLHVWMYRLQISLNMIPVGESEMEFVPIEEGVYKNTFYEGGSERLNVVKLGLWQIILSQDFLERNSPIPTAITGRRYQTPGRSEM